MLAPTGDSSDHLLGFSYSDEPTGAVASETDAPSESYAPAGYEYDAAGRVTQMAPGSGDLGYAYDASGDATGPPAGGSAAYDLGGRLCWSTTTTSTDACGSAPSGATTYGYGSNGNLTSASGTPGITAAYDGKDELTSFAGDGTDDLSAATYDGDGLRAEAGYAHDGVRELTWDSVSGSVPKILSDGVVSASGSLEASTAYDAWGSPETSGGLSSYTPIGFAGGYTDRRGLVYLDARYYDPQLGAFLSVDPDLAQTGQPYAYAGDDPVDSTDPTGKASYLTNGAGARERAACHHRPSPRLRGSRCTSTP